MLPTSLQPCWRFKCLANVFYYIENTKVKANPVKLFHAESVVLSSLMIRAFVQFALKRAIRQANYSNIPSLLEPGPFMEKYSEQRKGRILLSTPKMSSVTDRFSQGTV